MSLVVEVDWKDIERGDGGGFARERTSGYFYVPWRNIRRNDNDLSQGRGLKRPK